ncbi:uncharacterized protein RAG0_02864 [Rhynchosporium agropyri]|uniref:EKC/KEOPS complex subunit BUD32 n=1 Tax=Rhynchosporium agropyri TaxID=914238 RepID=A0A1E1K336_9HELO|nr:uncharacterized protein RAG0_02864 [Rhynchosporium agropyri]
MDSTGDSEELDIIKRYPINDGLAAFRKQFGSVEPSQKILSAESASEEFVGDLVTVLLNLKAASVLRSRINTKTPLRADLFSLGSRADAGGFDLKLTIPLAKLVVKNATDTKIWHAVFDLIARTNQSTPTTALQKGHLDTPYRSSSASQIGPEEIHDDVDRRICEELTGRVFNDVEGFYKRYFEGKNWTHKANAIYEVSRAQYIGGRWSGWSEPAVQGPFFKWFMMFQDSFLSGLDRRYCTSANQALKGSEAGRKLDIFLTSVTPSNSKHDWSGVLVIGEHKQNPAQDRSKKILIQLAGYAREVFGSQPDRRFVPGFTICGSLMRLWVFDRSGAYSSKEFDIHEKPERFVKAIAGYALMTDAELGLNTFIKRDGNDKYIRVQGMRISLQDKPIASTKAIVCRGTTCYRGRKIDSTKWEYVVKFAWPSDKRQGEGELLKLAKERGATGIAVWINHEQIIIDDSQDSISHLRRDMNFGTPQKLSIRSSWVGDSAESSQAYSKKMGFTGSSMTPLSGLASSGSTTSSLSGVKRKGDERSNGSHKPKRSKSNGSLASASNVHNEDPLDPIMNAPSIQETLHDSLAGCRRDWERRNVDSMQEAEAASLTDCESETYGNRIHYCLVTSPAGRPLREHQSVKELLEALRDAIRGHKSLLEDGKILHRDVSENNIIITDFSAKGASKGRLIDLDLAKELDSKPSGARHRTGTMQFMAIEVLEGKGHTYRHDLESFFYVFLWMCIRYGYEDTDRQNPSKVTRPKTYILRGWYTGVYTEIANTKQGHMDKNRFENIVSEFAPKFENLKPLARLVRNVLFPIIEGAIFTGTFQDHKIMYNSIISAFEETISGLGQE